MIKMYIEMYIASMRVAPAVLPPNRWSAVDDVAQSRQMQVRDLVEGSSLIAEGRFLVYFPDCNLADGAAELESDGLLDVNNAPPFGTWLGYFEDLGADVSKIAILLAWIPRIMMARADAGIAVNPEQCVSWLDTTDAAVGPVVEFLETAGWMV